MVNKISRQLAVAAISLFACTASAQRNAQSVLNVTENEVIPDIPVDVVPVGEMKKVMEGWKPDLQHDTSPDVQLDGQVGSIPYHTRVGDNGRVLIDIPIETFANEYEFAPKFTLSFDGRNQRDLLGKGWRIGGLPVIERVSKTVFTDGRVSQVTLSDEDAFSLDGVRLILTDTLSDGTRHYLTQSGNTKVKYNPSTDTFVAYYDDGSTAHFTATAGRTRYRAVAIRHLDNRQITLSYGSSQLTAAFGDGRSIVFHYKWVNNPACDYVSGQEVQLLHHVDSILVKKDGTLIAGYGLGYLWPGGSDAPLTGVTRFAPDGHSLQWLRVNYNHERMSSLNDVDGYRMTRHFAEQDMDRLIVCRGNFDYGSGDDGFLLYPNRDPYYRKNGRVHAGKYRDTDSIIVAARYMQDSLVWCQAIPTGENFVEALAMDIDGASGDEIVKIQNTRADNVDNLKFTTYRFDGTSVEPTGSFYRSQYGLTNGDKYSLLPKSFVTGDFDGDGREELAIVYHGNPLGVQFGAKVELLDVGSHQIMGTYPLDSCHVELPAEDTAFDSDDRIDYFKQSDRILVTDMDGDGKHELAIMGRQYMTYYRFTRAGASLVMDSVRRELPFGLHQRENYATHVGDFNGDGVGDLALTLAGSFSAGDGPGTLIYLGKGDGTHELKDYSVWEIGRSYSCMVADLNRDGTTDIVYAGRYYSTFQVETAYYSNGKVSDGMTQQVAENSLLLPASLYSNGAASNTILVLEPQGRLKTVRDHMQWDIALQPSMVTDCNGNHHLFEYDRMTHRPGMVSQPGSYTFPYASFAEGMPVCDRHLLVSGGDTIQDERISYLQPVVHRQGLGFCGFERVAVSDAATGHHSARWFSPSNFAIPLCDSTDLSITGYDFNVTVTADKRIRAVMAGKTVEDLATGVQVSSTYTHDPYGNITLALDDYGGGLSRRIERQVLNFDTLGHRGIGFELERVETVTRGGQSMSTGITTAYNTDWLVDSIVQWNGSRQHVLKTERRRYTDSKRLRSVAVRPFDGHWQTTTFSHSSLSNRQTPSLVRNGKGQITETIYGAYGPERSYADIDMFINTDPPTPVVGPAAWGGGTAGLNGGTANGGQPAIVPVEPTGLKTRWHYDIFGRQDSVIAPDGAFKTMAMSWVDEVFPQQGYIIETTESGKPDIRTWYSPMDRKIKQATRRFDGTWTFVLYEYDRRGRLTRESMPTATGVAGSWTSYTYDAYDRLTSKTWPDGHVDTYTYDGLATTSTVDGVTTTRTVDALGNLLEVEDAGGTLRYILRPDGQPSAIQAPGGVSTTFEYDVYGRRTAINDPSAGRRETAYDADGNVAAETDARGMTVTSVFNERGLLTSRTFGDSLTATYTYNDWNLPLAMTGSDGHSKSWTYNAVNQLATATTDGFTKTYTYDKNVPSSVAYYNDNDYICTENYQRMNGHLTSVTLGTGDTIWTLRRQNSRLLPTRVGLGGLGLSLSYDSRGNVTERVVTGFDENELQWQEYDYDTVTGNMGARSDWTHDTSEWFDYDNLNRLTDIELYSPSLGYRDRSTTYDGKGNILSHSTAGQYGYGTAKPYAFSELLSPSALVPQREQHIAFNAMQRPDTISEGGHTAAFSYYGDMTRASMTVTDSLGHMVETRTYYDQQYNEISKMVGDILYSKRILWLGGTPYNAPAALLKDFGDSGWRLVHVLRDNLGSITHVVDSAGTVLQELSYSAWGLLRDPQTQEPYSPDSQPDLLLGRGYTGHEHLPWFGLVNMNARLYDPAVGRFLSPDPLVQAPDNTQNYNRYSYCLNNPLRWTDESGKLFSDNNYYNKYASQIMKRIEFYTSNVFKLENPKARDQFLEKISELRQSLFDFGFVKMYPNATFTLVDAQFNNGCQETRPTGKGQYTIYTDGSLENVTHEMRHACRICQGQISFNVVEDANGNYIDSWADSAFSIWQEVDAYRAQVAVAGDVNDNHQVYNAFIRMAWGVVLPDGRHFRIATSVSDITPEFVRLISIGKSFPYLTLPQ